MADVRPFRGIRYNPEAIGDIGLVVAPPFDVISPGARDSFYNRHPYNVIRLIMNRPKKSDSDPDQPYRRAAEFCDRWLAQRVLTREAVPSLYLYRQRYLMESEYKECTGLIARVRLEDFADGGILPHEHIMPKPLEDRKKLLEHTNMNFSLVHSLYTDPAEKLKGPILKEMEKFPIAQFQTEDGIAHDVWAVSEEPFVRKTMGFLKNRKLYIADGHHRYQTAFEHSRSVIEAGQDDGEEDPRRFLMMMIVEMENPGLSLLPVHRVVRSAGRFEVEDFTRGLENWFTVVEVQVPGGARSGQIFHLLRDIEEAGHAGKAFGVFLKEPEKFLLLSWKSNLDPQQVIEGEYSPAYKNLDVTVLHRLVIENLLGISPDRTSVESSLIFTRDPLEAAERVDSGEGFMAIFVNQTRVEEVRGVADHGDKMPQKSTYFHPKPCSGVVMNRITEW